MIEKLTAEQEALIPVVANEWINRLHSGAEIDKEAAAEGIKWLYSLASLSEPEVVFVDSPMAAQMEAKKRGAKDWPCSFSWYSSVSSYGWAARSDYYLRIGAITDTAMLEKYLTFLRSNIYDSILLEGLCIVCPFPSELHTDDQGRMHCATRPAIAWRDGYSLHYLFGVHFDPELFAGVTSRQMTFKDVMAIENMEQRMVAIKVIGAEVLLENAKLLDVSLRGNQLYLVEGVFEQPAYFLKYSCPSTGRVYVSGVDPSVGIDANADKAMAWKLNLSEGEYAKLRQES